jgi:hypothetical protein
VLLLLLLNSVLVLQLVNPQQEHSFIELNERSELLYLVSFLSGWCKTATAADGFPSRFKDWLGREWDRRGNKLGGNLTFTEAFGDEEQCGDDILLDGDGDDVGAAGFDDDDADDDDNTRPAADDDISSLWSIVVGGCELLEIFIVKIN